MHTGPLTSPSAFPPPLPCPTPQPGTQGCPVALASSRVYLSHELHKQESKPHEQPELLVDSLKEVLGIPKIRRVQMWRIQVKTHEDQMKLSLKAWPRASRLPCALGLLPRAAQWHLAAASVTSCALTPLLVLLW